MKNRKIILTENEIPEKWYNIIADMPNKPLPPTSSRNKGAYWFRRISPFISNGVD